MAHSGYGTLEPFIARQRIRLNTSSGQRSGWASGSRAETYASFRNLESVIFFGSGFISSNGTLFIAAVKGVISATSVKQSDIGVALASSWFIGGRPRISSIVRNRLVW